jgi:heme/copper-type cytochrome/quinol oxidase subunit 2
MTDKTLQTRHERRMAERDAAKQAEHEQKVDVAVPHRRLRAGVFLVLVAALLGGGVYLAGGDLIGQRGNSTTANAIPVRLSMAGFTPGEIKVPAGKAVALELWTTDAAPHLSGGVHTLINDYLKLHEELPAAGMSGESRKVISFQSPTTAGEYDIYCDTCCGGKESPTMHGKLIVEA